MSTNLSVVCSDDFETKHDVSFSIVTGNSRQTRKRSDAISSEALTWVSENAHQGTTARQLRSAKTPTALRSSVRKLLRRVPNAATVTKFSKEGDTSYLEFHSPKRMNDATSDGKGSSARDGYQRPSQSSQQGTSGGGATTGRRRRRRRRRRNKNNTATESRASTKSQHASSPWTNNKSQVRQPLTRRSLATSKRTATNKSSQTKTCQRQSTLCGSVQSATNLSGDTRGTSRQGQSTWGGGKPKGGNWGTRKPRQPRLDPNATSNGTQSESKSSQTAVSNTLNPDWTAMGTERPSDRQFKPSSAKHVTFTDPPTSVA